jgi:hypothetical protein
VKTYISDILPKIKRFSRKLDQLTLLQNQHWVVLDNISESKNVYIFRENNQLLIVQNGKVEKAKWEFLGNDSLLIDKENDSYLFKNGFYDENILALKIDSKEEYAILVNESKYDKELNSYENIIDFLTTKYVDTGAYINSKGIKSMLYESPKTLEINGNIKQEHLSSKTNFWGNNIDRFRITFDNFETGILYKDGKGFYIIDETGSNNFYYCDKSSAIYSLYTRLKTNKVSYLGYKKWT